MAAQRTDPHTVTWRMPGYQPAGTSHAHPPISAMVDA